MSDNATEFTSTLDSHYVYRIYVNANESMMYFITHATLISSSRSAPDPNATSGSEVEPCGTRLLPLPLS